jgi:two-component sensor histidine kinase
MIHQKLYQSGKGAEVELGSYIQDLLTTVFSSFTERPVEIDNRIGSISIGTKKAVPLGLIINELATNAIKHGFTSEEEPRFTVAMEEVTDADAYVLTVSNTGNPFPAHIDFKNAQTLGLQLVQGLVHQLGGTLELDRQPHPVFSIRFPKDTG